MEGHFDSTPEGYLKAVKYLKRLKVWQQVSKGGLSTDGWSIVAEANAIYHRRKRSKQNTQLKK